MSRYCARYLHTTSTPSGTSPNGVPNIFILVALQHKLFIYLSHFSLLLVLSLFHSVCVPLSVALIYENRTTGREIQCCMAAHRFILWNLPLKSIDFITITFTFTFIYDRPSPSILVVLSRFSSEAYEFGMREFNADWIHNICTDTHASENDGGVVELKQNGTSPTPINVWRRRKNDGSKCIIFPQFFPLSS